LSDLEDGSLTASELASESVHALMIHAGEVGVDAGDAAALAALELIVRVAVYGRAQLKVVLDSIAAAATVRVIGGLSHRLCLVGAEIVEDNVIHKISD
jgi:hypothetical protein